MVVLGLSVLLMTMSLAKLEKELEFEKWKRDSAKTSQISYNKGVSDDSLSSSTEDESWPNSLDSSTSNKKNVTSLSVVKPTSNVCNLTPRPFSNVYNSSYFASNTSAQQNSAKIDNVPEKSVSNKVSTKENLNESKKSSDSNSNTSRHQTRTSHIPSTTSSVLEASKEKPKSIESRSVKPVVPSKPALPVKPMISNQPRTSVKENDIEERDIENSNLILQNTVFGFVVSGCSTTGNVNREHCGLSTDKVDFPLRKIWPVEGFEKLKLTGDSENSTCEKIIEEKVPDATYSTHHGVYWPEKLRVFDCSSKTMNGATINGSKIRVDPSRGDGVKRGDRGDGDIRGSKDGGYSSGDKRGDCGGGEYRGVRGDGFRYGGDRGSRYGKPSFGGGGVYSSSYRSRSTMGPSKKQRWLVREYALNNKCHCRTSTVRVRV
ncbi:apoptosis-stimulating of p53 protein 1 [Caerostris extrusa]|uniref:Apoptosis-stimulating of p53 protein 1 n=1 Tax=Caerostris extrusa TaxID=172846 RepID=A0AAV4SDE8_CAEEX|nr:apoptosis-stimulating of p53 protein 1 [Caerostris extrusa]